MLPLGVRRTFLPLSPLLVFFLDNQRLDRTGKLTNALGPPGAVEIRDSGKAADDLFMSFFARMRRENSQIDPPDFLIEGCNYLLDLLLLQSPVEFRNFGRFFLHTMGVGNDVDEVFGNLFRRFLIVII
jgi:hypothetical protein